ncbi:hypothetical protein [Streptosporangium sp. NPDC049376]|uniref:hypothetical protein n=1 Tax=Streptosporangium sp. NPDC049376 TaxID=3366192 RepID=UPI003797DA23
MTNPLQRQPHPAGIVGARNWSVDLRKQRSERTGSRPTTRALSCLPGGVAPGTTSGPWAWAGPSGVTETAPGS